MKKFATAAFAALIGVVSVTATISPAAAGSNGHYKGYQNGKGNGGWNPGPGVGFAAGALLGLGVGAIVTSPRPAYRYAPAYPRAYYPPVAPTYYAPPPPPPVYAPPVRNWQQAHVNWCFANYRSYNVQTDTFTGYDGYIHRCVSPY